MVEIPVSLHILGEEEWLLQSLGHKTSVPPAVMPKGGIIRNWHTVYLQLGRPSVGVVGALEPQEAPLGYQQSWTSCFFGPVIAWAACFLWKGPSHLPQEPQCVSSSLDQGWALARDQQEAEEEEEEDSLAVWTCFYLEEKAPCFCFS